MMVSSRRSGWSTYPAQISHPHLRNKAPQKKMAGGGRLISHDTSLVVFFVGEEGVLFQQFLNSLI